MMNKVYTYQDVRQMLLEMKCNLIELDMITGLMNAVKPDSFKCNLNKDEIEMLEIEFPDSQ